MASGRDKEMGNEGRGGVGIVVTMTAFAASPAEPLLVGPPMVPHVTSPAAPTATPVAERVPDTATKADLPWLCICWDDPVNLMSYVTYVFQTVLGYSRKRATELMMEVHTSGKAVVSSGERDKVEADVKKLHTAGLWATMQRSDG
ncbi:ATP-dependent Clp protease adaptor protein ClpS [Corynebacterium heidelbergense]|nr:ATP-dependent Clp protease adaptor protein ClpS [Corynebacterium heidelbergense]